MWSQGTISWAKLSKDISKVTVPTQLPSAATPLLLLFLVAWASTDLRTSGSGAVEEAAPHRKQLSEVDIHFLLTKRKELIFILLSLLSAGGIVDHHHCWLLFILGSDDPCAWPPYYMFSGTRLGGTANILDDYMGFRVILIA